jgi:glycine C-acetyltransferase
MADIFERLLKNYGPIGKHRKQAHGYFAFPKLEGEISSRMKFRGKDVIVWSLNNYLGLANHPEVRKADADGASEYGLALPMGARMMSGNSDLHEQLESELGSFCYEGRLCLVKLWLPGNGKPYRYTLQPP